MIDFPALHVAASALQSNEWYAARHTVKSSSERRIERLMIDLARQVAIDLLNEWEDEERGQGW